MTAVSLGNGVVFSANNGVVLSRDALKLAPEDLHARIHTAYSHMNDTVLVDAGCGGIGLLAERHPGSEPVSYDVYLNILDEAKAIAAAKEAKRNATRRRRKDFEATRADLILALLEEGHIYQCAQCGVATDLTVDHLVPLSRGGTDALTNLQFLCRPCNSKKGTRILRGDTHVRTSTSLGVGAETQTQ